MSKAQEIVNEMLIAEGVNDKNIFKAIIMAGGPGSGKSFILKSVIGKSGPVSALGAVVSASDEFFERRLLKLKLPLVMDTKKPEIFAQQMKARGLAKEITGTKLNHILNGMLPVVLDGTGKSFDKIKDQKQALENIGYDVGMVFVNTSLDVALQRNQDRERSLDDKVARDLWKVVQENIGAFQSLFGSDFVVIDNSKHLEGKDLKEFQSKLFKTGKKLLEKPIKSKIGNSLLTFLKLGKLKLLSDIDPKNVIKFNVKV
jgi:hypothetical protein